MCEKKLFVFKGFAASWVVRLALAWFLLIFSCLSVAQDKKHVSIAAGEYLPWSSEKLEGGGFLHRIITEAFELQGVTVEYTYYPWARSYEQAKAGKYDAASFWACSVDRQEFFYCSNPIGKEDVVFFYHRDKPLGSWQRLQDLKGYRIGATQGYTYTRDFWDAANSKLLDVRVVNRDELSMKMLLRQRLDLVVMGYVAGVSLINTNFKPVEIAQIRSHSNPLTSLTFHLLVPRNAKNGKELIKEFNAGLIKLRASGKYQEHFQYYFPPLK